MQGLRKTKIQESSNYENLEKLLDKLRWVTLGYHHNWDTKHYSDYNASPFPDDLKELCQTVLSSLGKLTTTGVHQNLMHNYNPEAAIINFYPASSSLGGHTDHSEPNRYQDNSQIHFRRFSQPNNKNHINRFVNAIDKQQIFFVDKLLCYHFHLDFPPFSYVGVLQKKQNPLLCYFDQATYLS